MSSSLATLRQLPQPNPVKFLAAQPGCWIQYCDDTSVKDPAKALSARTFNVVVARRKQLQRCAIFFSLQAFEKARTKEEILSYRNLGVDVDLVAATERHTCTTEEIDRRKEDYLAHSLLSFPLKPQWLVETGAGFHAIFRVLPQRHPEGIREAAALNQRLVRALHGDVRAALLTQVLRVPSTLQFKDPAHPFLCRLLVDNGSTVAPYDLATVRSILDAWEVFHAIPGMRPSRDSADGKQPSRWRDGLNGVSEGARNATAAALAGAIIGRLPEQLWETAGWGGLKEWNQRNAASLPERELRSVFESIARRESAGRRRKGKASVEEMVPKALVRIDIQIQHDTASQSDAVEGLGSNRREPSAVHFPATPC